MKRKTYTRKLKFEAVQFSEQSDRPIIDVANDLGIYLNTLYKWRRQLLEVGEEVFPGHSKMKASYEEVRRLGTSTWGARRIKKAIAFVANNPG